jgi:membrane-associated protein
LTLGVGLGSLRALLQDNSMLQQIIDLVLHLDVHLAGWSRDFGGWTYVLLFAIVFCETGLVVAPFLPGDSLLFAAGAVTALPDSGLNPAFMALTLMVAAVMGDALNYAIGYQIGARIVASDTRWVKRKHIEAAEAFYKRHGGKAIIIARFAPILRTFAPFVAGIGRMMYRRFALFNVVGGIAWVGAFVAAGNVFGDQPWVKQRFHIVLLAIIAISLLPPIIEVLRARRGSKA